MSAEPQSVELVRREASEALERPLPYMSDGEVAAAYRTAKALADSGMFKDARQPGQAFAKMLAGRDLGLTPFESMSALHVIEGKIEAGADLHATRVRSREGYDYRLWWLKVDGPPDREGGPPKVVAVAAEDEDPADIRDVYGCAIEFLVGGERRGIGRWTVADTARAGLAGKDNHKKYPGPMCFARAMSQGVSQHVPEVMGGLRVYAPGELGKGESGEDLAAGTGETPAMDNLPTAVEAVIARATELGHAGLARRERWAALAGQPAEAVGQAVARATRELNAHAARKRRGEPEPAPEPPDAEVVPERCGVEFGAGVDGDPRPAWCELPKGHDGPHTGPMVTPSENKAVSRESEAEGTTGTGEASAAQDAQPQPVQRQESAPVVDGEVVAQPERAEELHRIAAQLLEDADAAEAEGNPDEAERLRASAAETKAEADALADPSQPGFQF